MLIIMKTILAFVIFYIFFMYVFFKFCLCWILIKENYKPYFSFIPFYGIYLYLKICKLPFWTIFIPIVNIVVLFCSPYRLSRQYRLNRTHCVLSILFPFIYIPYIAFSKIQNYEKIYNTIFIKNKADLEMLENKLESANNDFDIYENHSIKNIATDYSSLYNNDNTVEIEYKQDEIIYDDDNYFQNEITLNDHNDNLILEIDDEIDKLSLTNLENVEEKIINDNTIEKNISTNISEYKKDIPTTKAIAFGGDEQLEELYSVQTKNDELKCKRCGSSLIGANKYCPGCGTEL